MTAREKQYIVWNCSHVADDPISALSDLMWRFATGAPVDE